MVNSLLNFRAVSQHARPRYGSYPNEMLVNYLGAALGVPSGSKVSAFLSNLVDPDHSVAVTIDTHMQQFLLGAGRQTLYSWEYAVLEDYLRALAKAVSDAPHRLQVLRVVVAIIWWLLLLMLYALGCVMVRCWNRRRQYQSGVAVPARAGHVTFYTQRGCCAQQHSIR